MNRDRYNDYEWYESFTNHRNVTAAGRIMNNTGINRHHKRNRDVCGNLWMTVIVAIVFTVFMYAWLA